MTKLQGLLRALGGGEMKKNFDRFARCRNGAAVLEDQRDIVHMLNDRDYLASMPEGSLGRIYLDFVRAENLTADGLVAASDLDPDTPTSLTEDEMRFQARLRDTHDLWHVVSGYGRDGLGELCLLAFTYAQTKSKGIAFIIAIATMNQRKLNPDAEIVKAVREGYRHGKDAAWLPAADWESLLPQPLDEVRCQLGWTPADQYATSLQFYTDPTFDMPEGSMATAA